jgi:hypothetical protein
MNLLLTLALAAGAAPQAPPPPAPPPSSLPPAGLPARLDGHWSVVYAEQAGHRIDLGPALDVRNGAVVLNLDGQARTYRLDFGPGHTLQAAPVTPGATAPVTPETPAAPARPATPAAPAVPGTGTRPAAPVTAPGVQGVGSGAVTGTGSGPRTGDTSGTTPAAPGTSPNPNQGTAGRASTTPGALDGVFILSNEFLCLSLSPTGTTALGPSPGTVRGPDVGPGAAPGTSTSRYTAPPPAVTPTLAPGVRHDALVVILRRSTPPAR